MLRWCACDLELLLPALDARLYEVSTPDSLAEVSKIFSQPIIHLRACAPPCEARMEQSLPADCKSDSWQQLQSNSSIRGCLAPAGHQARSTRNKVITCEARFCTHAPRSPRHNNRAVRRYGTKPARSHVRQAQVEPTSPHLYKENNPPQQNDEGRQQRLTSLQASSNGSSTAAPATPQQRPPPGSASTFKQRVQAKMAELERSIQKVVPGHSRLASISVTDEATASQDSMETPSKMGGLGGGCTGALPMLTPLEAEPELLRPPSITRTHSRNSASDPAVQHLAYQSGESTSRSSHHLAIRLHCCVAAPGLLGLC